MLNLAVNAKDAMPHGGALRIDVRPCEIHKTPPAARIPLAAGRYAALTMTDTGGGMTAAVAARLFEPFFTTKEPNKGTGLGLATVYAIVEQSGGSISVFSQVDHGTTFTIYWPSAGSDDAPLPRVQVSPAPMGTETILLVEDDPAVREFCQISLERHGYRVLTAADGAMAAKIVEEFPGPIALLLTDVVMPDISGDELASAVTKSRAGIQVLFTSGYTDDALLEHGVAANTAHFLAKPYSGDSLARKVRDVLDRPVAPA